MAVAVTVSMSVAMGVTVLRAVAVAADGLERCHGTKADQDEEELKEPPTSSPPLPLQHLVEERRSVAYCTLVSSNTQFRYVGQGHDDMKHLTRIISMPPTCITEDRKLPLETCLFICILTSKNVT